MSSSLRAMIWEQWKTSRADTFFRILYATGFVVLFAQAVLRSDAGEKLARGLSTFILLICSVTSTTWLRELSRENAGFRFRLGFARPVSTLQLVAVPTVFGVVTSMLSFLVPALMLNTLAGISMPIVAPLSFIACVVVCCIGATWSWTTIVDRMLALCVLVSAIICIAVAFHAARGIDEPALLASGDPDYFRFAWWQYAMLAGAGLLAFAGTVVAVERQRHGEGLSLVRPIVSWFKKAEAHAIKRQPFSNRFAAHFAYELRRCGPPVITLGIAAPVLVWVYAKFMIWMYPHTANDTFWDGEPMLWMLGIVLCPIVYQILALNGALGLRTRNGHNRFATFDATRPMTNDELVGVKLTAVAVCTFAGWLCMCLGGFIFAVTDPQIWPKLVELSAALRSLSVLWWLATACLIAMTYVGSASFLFSTALWMPQHPRILAAAIIAVFAHLVAALSDGGNGWQWTSYWRLAAWVVAVAIISAGVYAIVNVVRLRALKPWILGSLVCLWLVYVGITLTLWNYTPTNGVTLPAAFAALGWALLTVPLSASVGAPLALASQRHLN